MQSKQSAPMLEEILQALGQKVGNEVTADAIEEELQRYLDYGVPPNQARNTILRHHGVGTVRSNESGSRRTLVDLKPSESFVNLLVRVVAIQEKEIVVRGEPKRIQYGIFGDETMTRSFTAWKPIEVAKGDVIKVTGAYTKEYQGGAEIHLGDRALIEPAEANALPQTPQARTLRVRELLPGMSNVTLLARVMNVAPRSVTVQGQPRTVWSGLLADATGKVAFTSWFDFQIQSGQAVRIAGAYIRSFRGTPQFTFDEKATLETLADSDLPTLQEVQHSAPIPIADLYVGGGAVDVVLEASLLEVRPGSGLVLRCSQCNRVVTNDECRLHGKVTPVPDVRIKAILDDGTGALSAIFGRETTESLFGKSLEECQHIAQDAASPQAVEKELAAKLVGRPMRVRGNVTVDEFGPTLLVQEANLLHRDLAAAAEALLAELEGAF